MSPHGPPGHSKDDSLWQQLCLRCCKWLPLTVHLAEVAFQRLFSTHHPVTQRACRRWFIMGVTTVLIRLSFRLKKHITTSKVALLRCFFAITSVVHPNKVGLQSVFVHKHRTTSRLRAWYSPPFLDSCRHRPRTQNREGYRLKCRILCEFALIGSLNIMT
jgi:hypothetical protein